MKNLLKIKTLIFLKKEKKMKLNELMKFSNIECDDSVKVMKSEKDNVENVFFLHCVNSGIDIDLLTYQEIDDCVYSVYRRCCNINCRVPGESFYMRIERRKDFIEFQRNLLVEFEFRARRRKVLKK